MNKLTLKGQLIFIALIFTLGFLIGGIFIDDTIIKLNFRFDFADKSLVKEVELNSKDFHKPIRELKFK